MFWEAYDCRELGIGIVPFSPLARGFFSAGRKILENLTDNDVRKVSGRIVFRLKKSCTRTIAFC